LDALVVATLFERAENTSQNTVHHSNRNPPGASIGTLSLGLTFASIVNMLAESRNPRLVR